MQETSCPLCYTALETREVAPCDDCGGNPVEMEHLREGKHTYTEYEVFPGLTLILCDFCAVDFASYDPIFFGLPKRTGIGFEKMKFMMELADPSPRLDKFCANCERRLSFLRFLLKARELHAG